MAARREQLMDEGIVPPGRRPSPPAAGVRLDYRGSGVTYGFGDSWCLLPFNAWSSGGVAGIEVPPRDGLGKPEGED